jgi:putative adhesin Stv-like protein
VPHNTQELEPCMRESLVIISGHGAQWTSTNPPPPPGSSFIVPAGCTVTVWQGPGMAMDNTLGHLLDRGCTTSAFRRSQVAHNVVRTFDPGEGVPNLVLFPPGSLGPMDNQAGDDTYRVPAHANGVGTGGTFAANTFPAQNVNGHAVCNMVSLYGIIASARAAGLGRNFHWAACNSAPTRRKPWLTHDVDPTQSTNLLVQLAALFLIDSNRPTFPNP